MSNQKLMIKSFIVEVLLFFNILISYLGLYAIPPYVLYTVIPLNFLTILLFEQLEIKGALFISIIVALLSFFLVYANNTEYIIIFSLAFLCTKIRYSSLIKSLWIYVIGLLFLFIIVRYPEHAIYMRGDGTPRFDLGFNNPNILAKYAFGCIVITLIYNKRVLALTLTLLFFFISGSRTLLYCLLLYPVLMLYIRKTRLNSFLAKLPILSIFPLLTLLSVFLAEYSREHIYIDILLSFRPMHWINYLETYPISLLGHAWDPLDYYVLDNSFLQIMVRLGLVGITIISLLYAWILNQLIEKRNEKLIFCVVATLIYSVFENMLKYPLFNIATVLSIVFVLKVESTKEKYG